ncbi:complement component C9 [Tachyglossus aculeatus]|uniref:complement component C9 n=1 Tax=Tachyglossus aculeatus TaxID=9261 RepID=UPI0018F5528F|nr:complement component C9 [Tachyglossus aculeatus]
MLAPALILAIVTLEMCIPITGNKTSYPEKHLNRRPRELAASAAIDCKMSGWSEWSPCDPCLKQMYRSRRIERFGQFGGKQCFGPLGDRSICETSSLCDNEGEDCGNDFKCESGRCIKKRLVCNNDNDCGDFSDENDCEGDPRSPCRGKIVDESELGRTAGFGLNILGMDSLGSPFDNEYFHGLCDRVQDGNTRTYYRKPWNVAVLKYETKADKKFRTDVFMTHSSITKEVFKEMKYGFELGLSLKVTEMEAPSCDTCKEEDKPTTSSKLQSNLGFRFSKTESINKIIGYSTDTKRSFLHVKGEVQLGRFTMRSRDFMLTSTFLDDLKALPLDYEIGEYFAFLETYGTHFSSSGNLGGAYELVYVLDDIAMKEQGFEANDVQRCLGYNFDMTLQLSDIEIKPEITSARCSQITVKQAGETNHKNVIDDVIVMIEGGTVEQAAKLREKLTSGATAVDASYFVDWAASLRDAPVLIHRTPSPIYNLVPVKMKDAQIRKKNLERSIEDYIIEFNVCKCQPCQNGGTVMLVDGKCSCSCSLYFKGVACEIQQSPFSPAVVVDGSWSCWSSWSPCRKGERSRTRQCVNPAPGSGGRPCQGDNEDKVYCGDEDEETLGPTPRST